MLHTEPGVIGTSFIEFTVPSDFARRALYCCPQTGHFYCNKAYDIRRKHLDMFLMFFICEGSLKIETNKHLYTASANEIVLLDCRREHRYYCEGSAEFFWFHFTGNNSSEYCNYLLDNENIVFSGPQIKDFRFFFTDILNMCGSINVDEHQLSLSINNILCFLANSRRHPIGADSTIYPALNFIHEHFSETIDLGQMAELCMISIPHLIRCFKKDMNCTPHDYLLSYRIRQAKQMLSQSSSSIEEIAVQCGFNSISHFSRAFRKSVEMTPSEFRSLW